MMKSKIVFFLLITTLYQINTGCDKKKFGISENQHIIPNVPVYTIIDMGIGGESSDWRSRPKYISISSEGKALGYGGHGILIFTSDNDEYKCYDATCTNCTDLTSSFTQKDLKSWTATCPVCGTAFLLQYGYPEDKDLKIYPLKEYPIVKSGKKLIISN